MTKLAIFIPSLNGGGAERVMAHLANAIVARGYKLDLVLAKAQGPYLQELSPEVNVIDLKASRVITSLLPLIQYLKNEKPFAMVSAIGHANIVALLARRLSNRATRIVVSERGTISGEYDVAKGFISKLTFKLIPYFYKWADEVCAVSIASAADLVWFTGLPAHRVTTIYNPFNLDSIKRLANEPLNHVWFSSGQPPVILAIGRLNEAKDFPVLIDAFSELRKTTTARLMILGDGELRNELELHAIHCGLSNDDFQLIGFVRNPYAYLSKSELFVLSSRREGLPGVLIEAMACGVPVISTDCKSGPSEILEGGRWGKLVPVGDAKALSCAMREALTTPSCKLPDVRMRAEFFHVDKAVDAYLNLMGVR